MWRGVGVVMLCSGEHVADTPSAFGRRPEPPSTSIAVLPSRSSLRSNVEPPAGGERAAGAAESVAVRCGGDVGPAEGAHLAPAPRLLEAPEVLVGTCGGPWVPRLVLPSGAGLDAVSAGFAVDNLATALSDFPAIHWNTEAFYLGLLGPVVAGRPWVADFHHGDWSRQTARVVPQLGGPPRRTGFGLAMCMFTF